MPKRKNPDTADKLIKAGYVPRAEGVATLRAWADGLERGTLIGAATHRTRLWVKLNLNISFEDEEDAK